MLMTISGHHVDLTEALKEYTTQKLSKIQRHFDHITKVQVILSVDKLVQKAEAVVHTAGAKLFADAQSEDLYAAIDLLSDKLDRQVVRHKEKHQHH